MAKFVPNQLNVRGLNAPGGTVFRHVQTYLREAQRIAKLAAPKNTGTLAASTRMEGPYEIVSGVQGFLSASALNPRTGQNYAKVVHQGRGAIVPVTKPALKFRWKGRWVSTHYVAPRAGRPFLFQGLEGANAVLPLGKFKIIVKAPPRTSGS